MKSGGVRQRACWGVIGSVLLGLLLGALMGRCLPLRSFLAGPPAPAVRPRAGEQAARPGPWGRVYFTQRFIEPPDGFVLDLQPTPARWFFKGYSRAGVEGLLQSAGVGSDLLAQLPAGTWRVEPEGVTISPPDAVLIGLAPDARALIYNTLGAFPENPPQFVSHRYRAGDPEEWFADSGLRPDTQHLITRMIYRRGNYLAFSDLLAVAARLPDAAERWRLCKTLSRRSTLFVSLHLDAESDLPALTRYWGRGGRAKDVGALLASVAQQPGGSVLDIAHLLPRGVRSLLYTFPRPLEQAAGRVRDCHWTSLSFFQWTPDDRFLDGQEVARAFAEDYQVVEGPPVLGDIVGLVGPDRGMVHSCVYVAADIVFTKNGNSWDMPWVLSTLEDVQSLYAATAQTPLSTVFLRGRSDGGEGVGP